jgi:hypothetical protein
MCPDDATGTLQQQQLACTARKKRLVVNKKSGMNEWFLFI